MVPEKIEQHLLDGDDARASADRRQQSEVKSRLGSTWSAGWLAFQCDSERRRLAPIPEHWMALSDAELESLCRAAVSAGPARRLVE